MMSCSADVHIGHMRYLTGQSQMSDAYLQPWSIRQNVCIKVVSLFCVNWQSAKSERKVASFLVTNFYMFFAFMSFFGIFSPKTMVKSTEM